MKILLLSPNVLTAPAPVYPIGLDYVAGSIIPRHEVKIVDLNERQGVERLVDLIAAFDPHFIGLSLRNIDNMDSFGLSTYVEGYRQIISTIRKKTSANIVLGGSGFTIFPSELMEALDADYGIVGDGERFSLLLSAIETGEDVSRISGVRVKGKASAGLPESRDATYKRYFDVRSPHVHYYLKQGGILNLQTKRGCPFRCIYCTYPHIDGSGLRFIDPDEVAQTALMLQEAGAKFLFITDSTFNCHTDHSLRVAKAFIKARLSIPWGAFFAPFKPPTDYYKIMAEAGLSHVEFGTESLCDPVLSAYGKPFYTDDVFYAHARASDAGLHIAHYLLFGGPGEDEKTIEETLANADKLEQAALILFCGIRIYPHTPIQEIAIRDGQIARDQNLIAPVFYRSPALSLDRIIEKVTTRAAGRSHWIFGSGGEQAGRVVSHMHGHGYCGPLWEHLIPAKPEP